MPDTFQIQYAVGHKCPTYTTERKTQTCHPPKSVVRGKTRVPVKISVTLFSGCLLVFFAPKRQPERVLHQLKMRILQIQTRA